ncbi:MAG: response regulator [Oscillospiraceae bacterium]|nr:response regulator [Oscillospiraceae bacterium]
MKLLLADSSEMFCAALKTQLERSHEVQICHDGLTVAQILFDNCPDLLVLDMMLPGLDGFTVLQTLRDTGRCVPVIVLANRLTQFEYNWLQSLQVDSVLIKPCTICETMMRIQEVARYHNGREACASAGGTLERILLSLGLRMNLAGYEYVSLASQFLSEDPGRTLTKEIYPAVAAVCGATPQSVERAIRTVIRDAWMRRNENVWRLYFSVGRDGSIPCPQNGTFLMRIAGCLMQLKKKADKFLIGY